MPIVIDQPIAWGNNALAIDSGGKLHITYYGSFTNLKYATNSSGAWQKGAIDSSGEVGMYSAVTVDSSGTVHIGYTDNMNHALKYVTW